MSELTYTKANFYDKATEEEKAAGLAKCKETADALMEGANLEELDKAITELEILSSTSARKASKMDSSTQMADATMENQMDSRLTALKVSSKTAPSLNPYRDAILLSPMNCCVMALLICLIVLAISMKIQV